MTDPTPDWDDEPEGDEPEEDEDEEEGRGASKHIIERLLDSRIVLLTEPISAELAQDIVGRLLVLETQDSKAAIDVYINSPGGSVDAGFAIYDMMRFIEAPVRCIANGLCASAAVIVLLAAEKKNRVSLPNSRFMIHQPSGGARGATTDIQIEAKEIIKVRERINELISEETGLDPARVAADTRRNYWMDAAEALQYGLISAVIDAKSKLA